MKSPQDLWNAALGELQLQVTKPNYNTWLKDTIGIGYKNDIFTIGVPNAFIEEWLESRLSSLIKKTLTNITGKSVSIRFLVQASIKPEKKVPSCGYPFNPDFNCSFQPDGGTSTKLRNPERSRLFSSKYSFDNFVTGESNRLAYAASLEVAENPGLIFNPLYIYGDTGLGKTHLLHAIQYSATSCGNLVIYTSAEKLTNEFVNALKNNRTDEFHSKYRNVDVLLVDDVQFLSGKSQTQECFFHIFNDLHENSCQIVMTSDCAPKSINSLGKRLKSRLEWGLVADIRPPDMETRMTILKVKARQMSVDVPDDVLQYIATLFRNNARELEGGLNRVVTHSKLSGSLLDINTAIKALTFLMAKESQQNIGITPKQVIDIVAGYYVIPSDSLSGKRRDRKTSHARQVAMFFLRENNHSNLTEIGRFLGGRDHSTVLHGCEKIAHEEKVNPHLRKELLELRIELGFTKKS